MKHIFYKKHSFFLLQFFCYDLFARAGGGGGGGGGGFRGGSAGNSLHTFNPFWIILLPLFVGCFIIGSAYADNKIKKKKIFIREFLKKMSSLDPEWSEENLVTTSKLFFEKIQEIWGNHNLVALKTNLSEELYLEWKSKIEDQLSKDEVNLLTNISFRDVFIVNVKNYIEDSLDTFTICFNITASEQTMKKNSISNYRLSNFREFWTFKRDYSGWKLIKVTQAAGWRKVLNAHIVFERLEVR